MRVQGRCRFGREALGRIVRGAPRQSRGSGRARWSVPSRASPLERVRVRGRLGRRIAQCAVVQDVGAVAALAHGLQFRSDGSATFSVWAPHAQSIVLQIAPDIPDPGNLHATEAAPSANGTENGTPPEGGAGDLVVDEDVFVGAVAEVTLQRSGDNFVADLSPSQIGSGSGYRLALTGPDGAPLYRRDPYAVQADYKSSWCYAVNAAEWSWTPWDPPTYDSYLIYELHIGSFTPEGTFAAAAAKLGHITDLGFTAVQLMPVTEHSDAWGYNPRQLLAVHGGYGTADDFQAFVDSAHRAGVAVVIDTVLHHGAVHGNALWDFDGWGANMDGGIYHEGAPDTEWGRGYAFWKAEVRQYAIDACASLLGTFHCDGIRFDSVNDLPREATQAITYALHERFPGRILMAELTPEDPMKMRDLGLDALWVHSGYFDIIQQYRALGRGHHGGGDYAAGWDLPRLRTVMGLHYGFEQPCETVKYLLGSHDQIGCAHGGAWYQDYQPIGGHHRYVVDQYGGGRTDGNAMAAARTWYAANVAAAGIPMLFMGTEWAQTGWWHTDEWHRLQWAMAEDEIGQGMMALVAAANALRSRFPALNRGWANVLHEDRANGVMAFERVAEGQTRIFAIVNAGQGSWMDGNYGAWVGHGSFRKVFSSQEARFGGSGDGGESDDVLSSCDGKLWLSIPGQSTQIFEGVAA